MVIPNILLTLQIDESLSYMINFTQADLKELFKLLIPKYYNRLTWLIVGSGITLLSKPIWIEVVNVLFDNFNFQIIGKYDQLFGLLIIVICLTYNTIHRYIDLRYQPENKPAYQVVKDKDLHDFGSLCQALLPILKDNEYIFKNCGPNSDANAIEPLRTDMTVWDELKRNAILPNNDKIRQLINDNKPLIPHVYESIFNKFVIHIEAFRLHVNNTKFDYSNNRFPNEISDIITKECYSSAQSDKKLSKIKRWLVKEITSDIFEQGYIFGSILLYPQNAKDVDIVLYSAEHKVVMSKIIDVKFDFKLKFKINLHVTFFERDSIIDYNRFLDKNSLKYKI